MSEYCYRSKSTWKSPMSSANSPRIHMVLSLVEEAFIGDELNHD